MKQSFYLIQRGTFAKDLNREFTGLAGASYNGRLIDLDYMGAAEFEWGAIPNAYRRLMYHYEEYKLHVTDLVTVRGVPFSIFCKDKDYPTILKAIKEYIENPYPLKEFPALREHFVDTTPRYLGINFWWCIDRTGIGNWMAFTGAADRLNKFMSIIDNDYKNRYLLTDKEIREEEYQKAQDW